ncbi:hypothetical protein CDD83_7172 [Cordyceps sp. RAO-2017]|nr:hypothetical protein CDD83_7172 [Cordyceps sp. RAO-2017]
MEALRLVSQGCDDRVEHLRAEPRAPRDVHGSLTHCLSGITFPSREVLLTLLWALRLEERKIERRIEARRSRPESGTPKGRPTGKYVLKLSRKSTRGRRGAADGSSGRRRPA